MFFTLQVVPQITPVKAPPTTVVKSPTAFPKMTTTMVTSTPIKVESTPVAPKPVVRPVVSSAPNNRTLFQALSTRIHQLRTHYMELTSLNKWYSCYSGRCSPAKVSNCYSPLCRKRYRLHSEMLELLHKASALNQANKENKPTPTTQQQQPAEVVKSEGKISYMVFWKSVMK